MRSTSKTKFKQDVYSNFTTIIVTKQQIPTKWTHICPTHLWAVCLDGWAALRTTDKSKVDPWFMSRQCNMPSWVFRSKRSTELSNSFPICSQHSILYILKWVHVATNGITCVVEEFVSLPKVCGRATCDIGMDHKGIVDVDEESDLLFSRKRSNIHTLKLSCGLYIAGKLWVLSHSIIVNCL